eukprot:scaffold99959_cov24-Phaeocystis_antarctica.AAC.1
MGENAPPTAARLSAAFALRLQLKLGGVWSGIGGILGGGFGVVGVSACDRSDRAGAFRHPQTGRIRHLSDVGLCVPVPLSPMLGLILTGGLGAPQPVALAPQQQQQQEEEGC